MKNLTYDNENARCVPYDSPPPGLTAQLQRLVTKEAILYWNTRPVPPLGRCVECANSPDIETRSQGMRWCRNFRSEVKPDGFCNSFAAKE